jgi:hypothetical protein
VWGSALLLLGLYLAPVLVSFRLPDPRAGVPWHQARRDPTGLSPDPATTQEAVIQVFAAGRGGRSDRVDSETETQQVHLETLAAGEQDAAR